MSTQLIAAKNKYKERAKVEKKLAEELEQISSLMCDSKETDKKKEKKGNEKAEKDKKKGEKGEGDKKSLKIETSEKRLSKLRKRGEEWLDLKKVEDSPPDGPDLYLALVGFYDPLLLPQLRNLHVPLNGLVKARFHPTSLQLIIRET